MSEIVLTKNNFTQNSTYKYTGTTTTYEDNRVITKDMFEIATATATGYSFDAYFYTTGQIYVAIETQKMNLYPEIYLSPGVGVYVTDYIYTMYNNSDSINTTLKEVNDGKGMPIYGVVGYSINDNNAVLYLDDLLQNNQPYKKLSEYTQYSNLTINNTEYTLLPLGEPNNIIDSNNDGAYVLHIHNASSNNNSGSTFNNNSILGVYNPLNDLQVEFLTCRDINGEDVYVHEFFWDGVELKLTDTTVNINNHGFNNFHGTFTEDTSKRFDMIQGEGTRILKKYFYTNSPIVFIDNNIIV